MEPSRPCRHPSCRRTAASALLLLAALPAACAPAERPPSALLITLDTTRVDALGAYGGPADVTPVLDGLAAESVVFDAARTVAPITLPAHASMLTGLYPPRHTLRDNARHALPAAARTLAEVARDAGYETAAFVAAVVLDRAYGLDQGFDVYRQPRSDAGRDSFYVGELSSEEVVARFEAWWGSRDPDRPFVAWVHLFDPHAPYEPPERFRARTPHPYLGEVAAMDEAVGRLVDRLRADGVLDDTLLVVVADHGESLGDHGEPSHGVYGYDVTVRVPLLVRPPARLATVAGRAPGERSDAVVSVVDVFPTVVEALGLAAGVDLAALDGVSLLREPARERGVYFETFGSYLDFGWSPLFGWADRAGKYLHGPVPELYDPVIDPREERDLVERRAEAVERYRAALVRAAAAQPLARDGSPAAPGATGASSELLEHIQGLGYTASGGELPELPGPLDVTGMPNPMERADELAGYARALNEIEAGRLDAALAILRGLVEASPRNVYAREALAKVLFGRGDYAACVEELDAILELRPDHVQHRSNLGLCHEKLGRPELAERAYRRALERAPDELQPLAGLVRVLTQAGRDDEARPYARRLRRVQERDGG